LMIRTIIDERWGPDAKYKWKNVINGLWEKI
jgi:hypothetical protein